MRPCQPSKSPRNIPQGDLADIRLAGHRLLSLADSRLFSSGNSLQYLRILVLPHIRTLRPTAWFGQEPDVVHSKSIPVVVGLFTLWAAAIVQITRVNIQAGATASWGHQQAGQSIRITMSAALSMLYHHVVLAKLLQPTC